MTTIPCILNDGKKLSIGDETDAKAEGRWDEAEQCRGDSVDSLISAWGTHMLMRFRHSHEVIVCERTGIMRAY